MITVKELKVKADRLYADYLRSTLTGETFFPKIIPADKTVSQDFNQMKLQLAEIIALSKDRKSFGYTIKYETVNTRKHGPQSIPIQISFDNESDYLNFIGRESESKEFQNASKTILSKFPQLRGWVTRYPFKIIENIRIWNDLFNVCEFFVHNPTPNLYIRELPIPVHTKFIENNKGILSELLNLLLPQEKINSEFSPGKDFERRFNLKYIEPLVRVRILDKELAETYFAGLDDLSIPVSQLNNLKISFTRVFVIENKTTFAGLMNFLTLPHVKGSIALFGAGFSVGNLKSAEWLKESQVYYWGDIDAHGLQILSRIRSYFPCMKALMMDFETLNQHKELWGKGSPTNATQLPYLSKPEMDLFEFVKQNNLLLEQEKIPQQYVNEKILLSVY